MSSPVNLQLIVKDTIGKDKILYWDTDIDSKIELAYKKKDLIRYFINTISITN